MQCLSLFLEIRIGASGFTPQGLAAGARALNEPRVRPECQLSLHGLTTLHEGKDASIEHMLEGGNGFPPVPTDNPVALGAFDLGCTQERRDLRALLVWQESLTQCLMDKGMI
jgi:hypothetical protein